MKEETPEDGLRKFVVKRLGRVQRNIEVVSRFSKLEDGLFVGLHKRSARNRGTPFGH